MKKLALFAICAMVMFVGCKNKGQTAPADTNDTLAAVIDSIIEENDTTPLPMYIIGGDSKYMHMLYWANLEEPNADKYKEECGTLDGFESLHKRWELQEMFRRNAAQYTNFIVGDKIKKVRFVDEVLKDPDGYTPSIGEIHPLEGIPALCGRFEFVNPKDKNAEDPQWGPVLVTDSYLKSRKQLALKSCAVGYDSIPPLPADIVKKMEKEYGMKAARTTKLTVIGDRYIHGTIEFQGEYKNAPKDPYDEDRKFALALELVIDSAKVYKVEKLGYYDPAYGATWNADADGYIPNDIVAAFEGPKGLELCYVHGAPESFCVGMIYLRDGRLIEYEYECFHSLVDEELPVWNSDIAEMRKLYAADDMGDKDVDLVKWAHCFIDYDNEWIWMRDKDDQNGAFFIRTDGKFQLIAIENRNYRPSRAENAGTYYLILGGPAGGPAWVQEIIAFKGGKQVAKFNCLQVEGEIDECSLNGRNLSKTEGQAWLDRVPEGKEITAFFKDVVAKKE